MKTDADKGHLLVAEPSLVGDISFNRSVVLLAEHTEKGSVGFIMNKPLNHRLSDFVPKIACCDIPIYNGGPVEQDNLYFIHTIPHLLEDSLEIDAGIFWGGDFEKLIMLLQEGKVKKDQVQFFLGYSGWDTDQLNQELEDNSWVVVKNDSKKNILRECCPNLWRQKIIEIGGDYLMWSNAPENPQHN